MPDAPTVKGKKIPKAVIFGGIGVVGIGAFFLLKNKKASESEKSTNGSATAENLNTQQALALTNQRELLESESGLGYIGGGSSGLGAEESGLSQYLSANQASTQELIKTQDEFINKWEEKFPAGGPPAGTEKKGVVATAGNAGPAISSWAHAIYEWERRLGVNTHPKLRGGHDTAAEERELKRREGILKKATKR